MKRCADSFGKQIFSRAFGFVWAGLFVLGVSMGANAAEQSSPVVLDLTTNVRAGLSHYQVYNVPRKSIKALRDAGGRHLVLELRTTSLVQRACIDADEKATLHSCEGKPGPVEWGHIVPAELCFTAQRINGRGPLKSNLCLMFSHGLPIHPNFDASVRYPSIDRMKLKIENYRQMGDALVANVMVVSSSEDDR